MPEIMTRSNRTYGLMHYSTVVKGLIFLGLIKGHYTMKQVKRNRTVH